MVALAGVGNGPLQALVAALPARLEIMDYHEHAMVVDFKQRHGEAA
ncbi:hypothetical protein SSTU70S_00976 [Stutzerimonas stutzeri]